MANQQKSELKNYKTIIVGKSSVGKSTILVRFVSGKFDQLNTTVAVDYQFKQVTVDKHRFNLELWDTAGQERYKTIVFGFFKLSKAACVVFDLTSQSSLDDVKSWMDQLEVQCGKQIPKILLGNKSDLLSPSDLKQELDRIKPKIQKIKHDYDCQFFPVSAKTGQNIQKAFDYLSRKIAETIKSEVKQQEAPPKVTFKLDKKGSQSKIQDKKKCCS